ncbi:MAG: beta-lactamase family protein, partial [Deltaproteobacteria bacterium]|nr:beta-lactamase family protein [Deltaproteobacteria bacterium]
GSEMPYVPDGSGWNVPYKKDITIEQLLQHSAGVYDIDNDKVPECDGMSYTQYVTRRNPNHQFTAGELVGQAAAHRLFYFVPGDGYHYSNTGYSMLGEIIARVYSFRAHVPKTYTDYLKENITGGPTPVPLAMGFPYLATDQRLPDPHVCGIIYTKSGTEVCCHVNMSAQVAEGNGYGTLRQINHYIRSLMRGQNVLKESTVSLMQHRVSKSNPSYALGCEYRKNLGYGHNGARVGNLAFMAYNPDTEVSVVVYLPLWDLSTETQSFRHCFQAMYDAAYAALKTLGYPGRPK